MVLCLVIGWTVPLSQPLQPLSVISALCNSSESLVSQHYTRLLQHSFQHIPLLWRNGFCTWLAPTLCLTSCYRPGVCICTKCQYLHNAALKIQGSRVVAAFIYILLLSYTTIDLKLKKNTKTIVFALYLRWLLIIRWFLGLNTFLSKQNGPPYRVCPLWRHILRFRWIRHPGGTVVGGGWCRDKVFWVTRPGGWDGVDSCYWVSYTEEKERLTFAEQRHIMGFFCDVIFSYAYLSSWTQAALQW